MGTQYAASGRVGGLDVASIRRSHAFAAATADTSTLIRGSLNWGASTAAADAVTVETSEVNGGCARIPTA